MKISILFFLFALFTSAQAQKSDYNGFPSLVWPKLYDITYTKASDGLGDYDKPLFSDAVKALNNKVVVLPGYMVPLENTKTSATFMLSSLPLNACFFCGVGGPETAVEVKLKSKTAYIERPIQVRGTLRLNDKNPDQMMYLLDEAEVLGTLDY